MCDLFQDCYHVLVGCHCFVCWENCFLCCCVCWFFVFFSYGLVWEGGLSKFSLLAFLKKLVFVHIHSISNKILFTLVMKQIAHFILYSCHNKFYQHFQIFCVFFKLNHQNDLFYFFILSFFTETCRHANLTENFF